MTPPSPLDEPFLTDRLCYIIAEQNEIIKEQANTIAQSTPSTRWPNGSARWTF